ncbi:acetylxylan esterase [Desertihabitans brevis]|uniref:Acetylxylan esterase n=1 Tax=Desertihabitans brevis TaxID=2268447 RepID=A0A367YTQ4_9ACTN|nr:acetylxylan esterase [Desertihabitans brevis]RCK69198.1 acetylxylan esterase [Desertihabitans brevis]
MPRSDLPLDQLPGYRCTTPEPDDLDAFWDATLAENGHPLDVRMQRVETGLSLVDVHDLTFAGYGGAPIRAWYTVPAGATGPLPTVVTFHGFSGGRGLPHQVDPWPLAGWAHLSMDTRGQGWNNGGTEATPDPDLGGGTAAGSGLMVAGVDDPRTYYYRRVYVDAVRALQAAATLEHVDADRIIATGGSQGGGLTIAAAALAAKVGLPLRGAMPDVPFLCDFRRSVDLASRGPYPQIETFLKGWRGRTAQVFGTLDYFDGVHLARRAACPALFSVAVLDDICPPSTVFAAYAEWPAEKQIEVYDFNGHEGGMGYQSRRQLAWAAERFAA